MECGKQEYLDYLGGPGYGGMAQVAAGRGEWREWLGAIVVREGVANTWKVEAVERVQPFKAGEHERVGEGWRGGEGVRGMSMTGRFGTQCWMDSLLPAHLVGNGPAWHDRQRRGPLSPPPPFHATTGDHTGDVRRTYRVCMELREAEPGRWLVSRQVYETLKPGEAYNSVPAA